MKFRAEQRSLTSFLSSQPSRQSYLLGRVHMRVSSLYGPLFLHVATCRNKKVLYIQELLSFPLVVVELKHYVVSRFIILHPTRLTCPLAVGTLHTFFFFFWSENSLISGKYKCIKL